MNASRRQWALLLLTAYFLLATFQVTFPAPDTGLDASWGYALNHLAESPLAFGRDVAFTYGPLGYLAAPSAAGGLQTRVFLFRLGLQLFLGAILCAYVARSRGWVPVCAFLSAQLVAAMAGARWAALSDYQAPLLVGLLLGLALRDERRPPWAYPLAGLAAVLPLFIKFNVGLTAGLMFGVGGLGLLAWRRTLWKWVCGSWLLALVAVAGLAAALLGSVKYLPTWLRAGLEIAGGYSSAMSQSGPRGNVMLGLVALVVYAALTLWLLYSRRRLGLLALALSVAAFAAFKSGFVRQDPAHEQQFFIAVLAFVSVLVLNAERACELAPALAALVLLLGALARLGHGPASWGPDLAGRLSLRTAGASISWTTDGGAASARAVEVGAANLQNGRLPEEWVKEVGGGGATVDVLPWEISYCPANGLSWSPLPTLQLYTAFTPWLDAWNARHFVDARVPDFVIVEYEALDGRHLLWDGPATWRAILNNYEVRRSDAGFNRMLLRRKARLVEPALEVVGEGEAVTGQWVAVPDSAAPLYVEMRLEPGRRGRLLKTFFRFPKVELELTYESGLVKTYRVAPDLARDGLLMNYVPDNLIGLAQLFACHAGDRVARFRVGGAGAQFLARPIKLTWKRAPSPCAAVTAPDPAADAGLPMASTRGLKPAELAPAAGETDMVIEEINGRVFPRADTEVVISARREPRLEIIGWAVDRQAAQVAGHVFVEIDGKLDVPTEYGINRPDVAAAFGVAGYRYSGFAVMLPVSLLGAGRHTLTFKVVSHDRQRYYRPARPLALTIQE